MDIATLTAFFMWCTIINAAIMVYWVTLLLLAPNWMYRMQSKWFPISRQSYDVAIYAFLGLFKIIFIVFNIVPYIALLIIG